MIKRFLPCVISLAFISCGGAPVDNGSDNDPNIDPNPMLTGAEYWEQQCQSCHGDFDSGISNGSANFAGIDAYRVVSIYNNAATNGDYDSLADYIAQSMPLGQAGECSVDTPCAESVANYIASEAVEPQQTACASDDAMLYGERKFVLLSSQEYQNSLEDLLGVTSDYGSAVANNDGALGGFTAMDASTVLDSVADTYLTNADNIAAWAIANGKPFTCADANSCATQFISDFAYKAFRRPLTTAEQNGYRQLFTDYGVETGLELAISAVLSSPQFLYRSEVGVSIAEAQNAGYYTNTQDGDTQYIPVGTPETISATNFTSNNEGFLENNEWVFQQNGSINVNFQMALSNPAILTVTARGSNYGDIWPLMEIRVGNQLVDSINVNVSSATIYQIPLLGFTGTQTVNLRFPNDAGVSPYGPGQDANLFIQEASLAAAQEFIDTDPNAVDPLAIADADAFVLTPYEYAAALSFMLTGSTPDETLLDAAENDRLTTATQIEAQVTRLIDSPRGQEHFEHFVGRWFRTDEVTGVTRANNPELTPEIKAAMAQEVREHFKHVMYNDTVPFREFYNSDYTFLNATLAQYYGVQAANLTEDFQQVAVSQRGGPLASGAFMTVFAHAERTSPIRRAVHSREMALCHHIDPPNSPLAAPDIDEQRAAAQARVEAQEAALGMPMSSKDFYFTYTDGITACASCHERIINPMFGLEDFDNVGRLRESAGAGSVYETLNSFDIPVNLTGYLMGVESVEDSTILEFSGAKDLSNQIAETHVIHTCLVRKGFRFVTGLPSSVKDLTGNETLSDRQKTDFACAAAKMEDALLNNNESPKAMFNLLGSLDLIRFRK